MDARYLAIFEWLMEKEGRYVNHKSDSGGETYCGITRRDFPGWEGWKVLDQIPLNQKSNNTTYERLKNNVARFYFDKFYSPMGIGLLSHSDVAFEVFDTGVNMGKGTAVRFLQRACNVLSLGTPLKVDGNLGPKTAHEANVLCRTPAGVNQLLKSLNVLQGHRYFELCELAPKNEAFIRGWLDHRVKI